MLRSPSKTPAHPPHVHEAHRSPSAGADGRSPILPAFYFLFVDLVVVKPYTSASHAHTTPSVTRCLETDRLPRVLGMLCPEYESCSMNNAFPACAGHAAGIVIHDCMPYMSRTAKHIPIWSSTVALHKTHHPEADDLAQSA